jgi:hypothetical protein
MGALCNHRGHTDAAATSDSAAALVDQMQTELRNLMSRREGLARRIRNLRQVIRGLDEISSAPAFTHQRASLPSPAANNSVTVSFPSGRTTISEPERHLQSGMPRKTKRVNAHLQRACRIALLEAETPLSLEEIFARIVRRGSFSFVNPERANPVLLQVLNAMAECGEVHLLESAPRWGRTTPLQEV